MEKNDLKSFYEGHTASLRKDIAALRRRNRLYVTAELATIIAAVGLTAAYTVYGSIWFIGAAVLMAVAYVVARRADVRNEERTGRLVATCTVYENELKYLDGDFSPFDDGRRYADPSHPFTYDMDVFGPQSLFHRINRTVTTGGSDELARMLSVMPVDVAGALQYVSADEMDKNECTGNDEMGKNGATGNVAESDESNASVRCNITDEMDENCNKETKTSDFIEKIEKQHQIIDRLASMKPLRTAFIARGHSGRTDTEAVVRALDSVRRMPTPRFASSRTALVAAWAAIAGLIVTILLSVFTPMTSGVPVLWGTVHLFAVLMLTNRPLREIGKSAGRLSREIKAYYELISILVKNEERRVKNPAADADDKEPELSDSSLFTLRSSFTSAPSAFNSLASILAGLDRRGNVLGLIAFDVFMLSDFFLVRRFFRWRERYINRIDGWLREVSRIDALVSMATFRYNEPQAGSAEIVDSTDIVYEAQGLWHPFLGERAVRNDFTISDSHYYIVTGANMAGKSTFLRSLGVNYILAMNGMPVFAERLRVSLFSLFSSMRTSDDLAHGISYFNAELLRLKQLIAHCRQHRRTLIILDEILKGTNSLDKLNGSRMFLDSIAQLPVSGVIATHDLELSRMAEGETGRFHNRCFEISLSDEITYTYKITPGVARNQNATYLLRGIIADIAAGTTTAGA